MLVKNSLSTIMLFSLFVANTKNGEIDKASGKITLIPTGIKEVNAIADNYISSQKLSIKTADNFKSRSITDLVKKEYIKVNGNNSTGKNTYVITVNGLQALRQLKVDLVTIAKNNIKSPVKPVKATVKPVKATGKATVLKTQNITSNSFIDYFVKSKNLTVKIPSNFAEILIKSIKASGNYTLKSGSLAYTLAAQGYGNKDNLKSVINSMVYKNIGIYKVNSNFLFV
jgi:hypothetical protein